MDTPGDGFEAWYRDLHPRLVTALVAAFGDVDIAGEAADEAIARACERWSRVSVMASPGGWTYRVAFNVARRRVRRSGHERRLWAGQRPESAPGPAGELWLLVADLPQRQRLAVVLRHVAHLPEAEIASVMGISRGGVSSTLRAAYRSLRLELADPAVAEEVPR